jgi:hypothetical protein
VSKIKEPKPLFKIGDWVSFQLPFGEAHAQIIEDRGPIGVKGRRLYRVSVPLEMNEPDMFEVAEESLKLAAHSTSRKA